MSACKTQKPELIAIYRLEFYKKQKNWKLSSSRKEKKPPKTENRKNLNITYNVNHQDSEEQSDPLNIAFVDSDSDKTRQNKCLKSELKQKELSQEWQEPVNIWPDSPHWDPPTKELPKKFDWNEEINCKDWKIDKVETNKGCAFKRLQELQKAADLELTQSKDDAGDYYSDSWQLENVRETELGWDRRFEDWAIEEDVLNTGQEQNVWTQAQQTDAVDGFGYSGDIVNTDPGHFGDVLWTEDVAELTVDSEGEFQRGADAAPHSSETELALPPCVNASDVSFSSLSRLSSSQLLQAARQHSRLLRRLLRESEHRRKLRYAASLQSFSGSSFEEFPTRDIGPYTLRSNEDSFNRSVFFKDVFVTGSYKNVCVEPRGRGRGRLVDTSLWK